MSTKCKSPSSVKIVTKGMIAGNAMDVTMMNSAGSMQMSGGQDISEMLQQAMGGASYSAYLRAQLERKISAQGGRCIQDNPEAQIVINPEAAGLKRRISYLPLPLFFLDIYQDKNYWALLDGTVDLKSGDGTRILQSQKVSAESTRLHKTSVFNSSISRRF